MYLKRVHIKRSAKRRLASMVRCQKSGARGRHLVRRYRRELWEKRKAWLEEIRLTPYYCGKGNGRYATPCAIVRCEGGYNNWNRMNTSGSGAYGPYQLLGWVPIPSPPIVQHRAAARLWRSQGSAPWAASRGCHGL